VNAIEPKYVKIKRTVFCLSSDSTETKWGGRGESKARIQFKLFENLQQK
jgi:hypothetical protein